MMRTKRFWGGRVQSLQSPTDHGKDLRFCSLGDGKTLVGVEHSDITCFAFHKG